jgi:hypothetical protein
MNTSPLEDKVVGRKYGHDGIGISGIYPVSREENAGSSLVRLWS